MKMRIPKKENLEKLNFEYLDRTVDQYYRLTTRFLMRKRLALALSLLGKKKIDKILDAGYGGGTFIPALSQISHKVYGVDTHPHRDKVKKLLAKEKVKAKLFRASILKLPFPDNFFDKVVCLSVLEHFQAQKLEKTIQEMYRVTKPGGALVIGIPGKNPLSDFFIKHILVFTPDEIHPSGHLDILTALGKVAKPDKIIKYPGFLPLSLAGFVAIRVKK